MDVLVVDDDPVQRHLLRRQLAELGYTTHAAADGIQAWELIQGAAIPLVITDWMMPKLDGLGLIQRIRAGKLPIYTYVILLTVRGARDDLVAGLDAGADDYMTKPSDPNELRARVAIGARIIDLETKLRAARDTDELTGLRNRRATRTIANAELAQTQRTGRDLSIVLLDIDHFKPVNDRYGHQSGDLALQRIALTLTEAVRPHDIVGRWGGEEFILLLPETELATALVIAERIRARVAATAIRLADEVELPLTVSLGVSSTAQAGDNQLDALVHRADLALYRAKTNGRNCVRTDNG